MDLPVPSSKRARVLPKINDDPRCVLAIGMTEPQTSSNYIIPYGPAGFVTSAKRKGLSFRWDCAPMPRGRQRATTFIWGGNCIQKSTRYPEECWAFLKYIAGPAGAAVNLAGGNALPVYRPAAEADVRNPTNPATPKHDRYFLDAIEYGRIAPYPAQNAEFTQAADHFDDVWLGRISVAEACRRFAREVDEALKVEVV